MQHFWNHFFSWPWVTDPDPGSRSGGTTPPFYLLSECPFLKAVCDVMTTRTCQGQSAATCWGTCKRQMAGRTKVNFVTFCLIGQLSRSTWIPSLYLSEWSWSQKSTSVATVGTYGTNWRWRSKEEIHCVTQTQKTTQFQVSHISDEGMYSGMSPNLIEILEKIGGMVVPDRAPGHVHRSKQVSTKCTWLGVRVSDPGSPEKMSSEKLRFFWRRVYIFKLCNMDLPLPFHYSFLGFIHIHEEFRQYNAANLLSEWDGRSPVPISLQNNTMQ